MRASTRVLFVTGCFEVGIIRHGRHPAFDLIGQMRLVDLSEVADQAGLLDRGAIERHPPLFADGFED